MAVTVCVIAQLPTLLRALLFSVELQVVVSDVVLLCSRTTSASGASVPISQAGQGDVL